MNHHPSPWTWPSCIALALAVVLLLWFAIPRHWIAAFFSPLGRLQAPAQAPPVVLILEPVPEIAVEPEARPAKKRAKEPPVPDTLTPVPDWWRAAWEVHIGAETERLLTPARSDSLLETARYLLVVTPDLVLDLGTDSTLAGRLLLWKLENQDRFEELKPYLHGKARSARYQEILNQGARLFDEFLLEEISVPDPPDQDAER